MLTALVFLVLATRWGRCGTSESICQVCDCIPFGNHPVQAFCINKGYEEKVLTIPSFQSTLLHLVFISGMKTVNFSQGVFEMEKPLNLIIQNCSEVEISDLSMNRLRSLIIQDVKVARVGALEYSQLWSVVLENIEHLTITDTSFEANYLVKIGNIGSLTVLSNREERTCENLELHFTLFNSVVNPISEGGLAVCGNQTDLESNTFKSVAEGGFQIMAESNINIISNRFEHLSKNVFNLSSPQINITNNNFDSLSASALSGVSSFQDTFFTKNTIRDIDLGGVLLDMSWGITVEENTIVCDCASKRTSILNPKEDMLYLTNSSHEILQNIFMNNYCSLNCSVTLKAFSLALIRGDVCLTNNTELEVEMLCDVTDFPERSSESPTDNTVVSVASRVEFLIPLTAITICVLITSSLFYGCKRMKTFRFVFNPQESSAPKLPSE